MQLCNIITAVVLAFMATRSNVLAILHLDSTDLAAITDEIKAHKDIVEHLEKLAITLSSNHSSVNYTSTPIKRMCFDTVEDQARKLGELHSSLDSKRKETFYLLHTTLKNLQEPGQEENSMLVEILGEKRLRHFIGAVDDVEALFEEGRELYEADKQLEEAYELFVEAWAVYNETTRFDVPNSHFDEIVFIDYVQSTLSKLGRTKEALELCQRAMAEHELNEEYKASFNVAIISYEQTLGSDQSAQATKSVNNETSSMDVQIRLAEKMVNATPYSICSEEFSTELKKKLATRPSAICRLHDRNRNPLLILAPIKEEILNLDPLVLFFHDISIPQEIEQIKSTAEDKFAPATVVDEEDGDAEINNATRRARIAWIDTDEFQSFANRIEAYTSMNPFESEDVASEMFQIGHYEIGGHYIPHTDYFGDAAGEDGDRIATLLIYLSDVERGGDTAFTELQLTATPKANGALFWFNVFKNETADPRTLHAACPVIKGEKWVANKWFRVRGQMLNKPCGLEPEEAFSLEDLNLRPIRPDLLSDDDETSDEDDEN